MERNEVLDLVEMLEDGSIVAAESGLQLSDIYTVEQIEHMIEATNSGLDLDEVA